MNRLKNALTQDDVKDFNELMEVRKRLEKKCLYIKDGLLISQNVLKRNNENEFQSAKDISKIIVAFNSFNAPLGALNQIELSETNSLMINSDSFDSEANLKKCIAYLLSFALKELSYSKATLNSYFIYDLDRDIDKCNTIIISLIRILVTL